MTLPNDVTRCLGTNCDERETCERYIQRLNAGPRTSCVDTLWDGIEYPLWCPHKIEVWKTGPDYPVGGAS